MNALEGSLIAAAGVVIAALVGWLSAKVSARAVDKASERQTAVDQDKNLIDAEANDIATLRELADQGRKDREELRLERAQLRREIAQERADMAKRVTTLESEVTTLRGRVTDLEQERDGYRQEINRLQRLVAALHTYIELLQSILRNLGHKPPPFEEQSEAAS